MSDIDLSHVMHSEPYQQSFLKGLKKTAYYLRNRATKAKLAGDEQASGFFEKLAYEIELEIEYLESDREE